MNREELEAALRNKSEAQFHEFVKDFGGNHSSVDSIIRQYVDHPEWEPRLCQLLGFLTEDEKKTQAALRASTAATYAAIAAATSALIALASLVLNYWITCAR